MADHEVPEAIQPCRLCRKLRPVMVGENFGALCMHCGNVYIVGLRPTVEKEMN